MEELRTESPEAALHGLTPVSGLYEQWFLDYASYVILDRAVPYLEDGLKPVQRRLLHALYDMDDGRFHKVANVIGQTMQYHPHGDASIGDALVSLGQKGLMLDTQGNWGNPETGDSAAAPRYIEVRLSKFALEVAFNPKTTQWQASYDGRKQEPVALPVKFPLLLAQGVEGIAVGLSTRILPHNFCELLQASIACLRGQSFELFPDFLTGGLIDVSDYRAGERGGRIRSRAYIKEADKKTLVITSVPFGVTTGTLIESILKASDKGKIKIRKVDDNTAKHVEIVVHLAPGAETDVTIGALYAFTDCEVSISPNCCVIAGSKPVFTDVHTLLARSTEATVALLRRELEIRLAELGAAWHQASLEKIFIEQRIYRQIETCETWEAVLQTIDLGLEPFKPQLLQPVTTEDILRLTEIRIKRISRFNSYEADRHLRQLEEEQQQVQYHLNHLTDYAIHWFEQLLKKHGSGRERRTELRTFDTIQVAQVAAATQKLYVNRAEGFVGTGLKKDEFVTDCSDVDDVLVIRGDGTLQVSRVADKLFMGKDIRYVGLYRRTDERRVYHLIYRDGKESLGGAVMVKRFQVQGITRDKPYNLTRGTAGSEVLYLAVMPDGERETLTIHLKHNPRLRKPVFEFDFGSLAIKGRSAAGNVLSKHPVRKVVRKSLGPSTLGGQDRWYDPQTGTLNGEGKGHYLGSVQPEEALLVLYTDGTYELTGPDLTFRREPADVSSVSVFSAQAVVTALYWHGKQKALYGKRFTPETTTRDKRFTYLPEEVGAELLWVGLEPEPLLALHLPGAKQQELDAGTQLEVRGWKAVGQKLGELRPVKISLLAQEDENAPAAEGPTLF